jgi:predicted dehydrogenase
METLKKINEAIAIIRKYYNAVSIQRTDNDNVVYLFDYINKKKTIGSVIVNKAVEKAMKQQDFPKEVLYSEGMLSIPTKKIEAVVIEELIEEKIEETEIVEETIIEEQPKKRGRKKQSEIDAES